MFLKSKNRTDLTDEEIILRYKQKNDLDMLGELYSRYVVLVYGLCLKYLSGREEAKDTSMQIFEFLTKELHQNEIRNFKSWLYVFSKNFCLMELRKQSSLKRKEEKWLTENENFVEKYDPFHPIDDEEAMLNGVLQDCIKRLKEEQKQCIRLFYFEKKSYREITVLIGFNEKRVKSLLQNGKRNLKICLEKKNVR